MNNSEKISRDSPGIAYLFEKMEKSHPERPERKGIANLLNILHIQQPSQSLSNKHSTSLFRLFALFTVEFVLIFYSFGWAGVWSGGGGGSRVLSLMPILTLLGV
jgi:hypothetical protein